jgi:hypothetical protein
VSVPLFETMPIRPSLQMCPGMMPALACPAVMMPGQFGPTRRVCGCSWRNVIARIMSRTGIPSVMHTTSASPESAASIIASAAKAGGTKMTDALAPVPSTASRTVSKIGHPSWVVPPFPGVTPPTTVVP